ncbi:YkgJ family cysteine cluster protein [Salmonella enterica]|uniref:YkgJ family cysteine cluster protein n=2 Tax=Salmonella enterica TaxID=28901 RepID=A0A619I248_SALER|nr:YkgJ family cysteine cluster protein [Salmonella enterica]EBR8572833.1 YkgJ family cysteine cluster protein [Salmonella enterica subsp. enterica serovar Java]EBW7311026.1 YkgJ family cysteine cluster protein [Salmonella enterica subsp. enterica serovar Enteritidis]EBW9699361.1 YkgJ family cysteine cluster protein [Salmonella enterica subsp. enterica serovar Oranienburg]EKN5803892.1 YkgJ family cysteine cluster protein [Salmonella enterica subsp. enterica]
MKLCSDNDEIKKRLKNYNPKKVYRMPVNENFQSEKLMLYLIKSITESDPLDRTYNLLMAADEIAEEMNVKNHAVCQKGCAYCCKIPVEITLIEARLISRETGKTINDYATIEKLKVGNSYCPFLDKNNARCTIYSVRPLACRSFYSVDHYKYCKNADVDHLIITMDSSSKWIEIQKTLLELSYQKMADIREWF